MIAESRKAWIAGLCLVAMIALDAALTELPLSGTAQSIIKIVGVILGGILTYAVPNAKPPVPPSVQRLRNQL